MKCFVFPKKNFFEKQVTFAVNYGSVDNVFYENNKIKEILDDNKKIKEYKYELIKYGSYYKLQLTIVLDSRLSLRQVTNLENKLKKEIIRHRKLKIKYVTIYVTNNLKKK